jgi:hypothetical protein
MIQLLNHYRCFKIKSRLHQLNHPISSILIGKQDMVKRKKNYIKTFPQYHGHNCLWEKWLYSFVCDYVGDSQLDKTPYCDSSSEEKKFQTNSLLLFLANYILLLFLYLLEWNSIKHSSIGHFFLSVFVTSNNQMNKK